MIALGRELAARGHEVTLQTWERWREPVEALGVRFEPAPEYHVFPTRERPLKPYEAVARATVETEPLIAAVAPDVVVADILTLAPALAAERLGVPWATLVPHLWPVGARGMPPFSIGARLPRTALGRSLWAATDRLVAVGLERGRRELNETRRRLGLPALERFHGGQSERLLLVATLPELEYPRDWPAHVHVVGPMPFELEADDVEPPPGDDPLVLVAPSTSQDPDNRLLRAALEGLAGEPVRVLAARNRRPVARPLPKPPNARVVEWLSYSRTMPGLRPRDLPRRPRHPRPRPDQRRARARRPRRGRHERERGPPRLGRPRHPPPPPFRHPARDPRRHRPRARRRRHAHPRPRPAPPGRRRPRGGSARGGLSSSVRDTN